MTQADVTRSITPQMLRDAFEKIQQEDHRVHIHILHPNSLIRDGWYSCECGPVPVRHGQVDWDWGREQMRLMP